MQNNWKIVDTIKWITEFFQNHKIDSPRYDAEQIVAEVLDLKRIDLYLHFNQKLSASEKDIIKKMVVRRANHEPLQYILGYTNFYGYEMKVNPDVLIPRPETEELVELLLKDYKFTSVLEIGTGSGAISIAIKAEKPQTNITACDISESALQIAQKNAKANNAKINFLLSDIYSNIKGLFDIIISNPPYITEVEYHSLQKEITKYEPKIALTADKQGLYFYEEILIGAKKHLHPRGMIFFEIGSKQAKSITALAEKYNYQTLLIKKDLNDFDRIMVLQLKSS